MDISGDVELWLDAARSLGEMSIADGCQWPDCEAALDFHIYVAGTGNGKQSWQLDRVEMSADANPGGACGLHALLLLAGLPRERIAGVVVRESAEEEAESEEWGSPESVEGIRAVLRGWPDGITWVGTDKITCERCGVESFSWGGDSCRWWPEGCQGLQLVCPDCQTFDEKQELGRAGCTAAAMSAGFAVMSAERARLEKVTVIRNPAARRKSSRASRRR